MEPLLTFDSLKSRFSRTYYYINLALSCIVFILRILSLPPFSIPAFYNFQPSYYGPGEVIPLNKEALNVFLDCKAKSADSNKTPEVRILLLDTLWSTRCLNFQPVVASLSLKLDLDEDTEYEKEFSIDTSATSLQLPTIILYLDGVEVKRLPNARYDSKTNALSLWDRSEEFKEIANLAPSILNQRRRSQNRCSC